MCIIYGPLQRSFLNIIDYTTTAVSGNRLSMPDFISRLCQY